MKGKKHMIYDIFESIMLIYILYIKKKTYDTRFNPNNETKKMKNLFLRDVSC